ncbi:MAG: hypothetical protein LBK99_23690 [Opitutaceae bacterium]|jgi:hypothetical protein|nr:hypothetical protein [Opitutaceae bacterium]
MSNGKEAGRISSQPVLVQDRFFVRLDMSASGLALQPGFRHLPSPPPPVVGLMLLTIAIFGVSLVLLLRREKIDTGE